jgi:hypothetical protein
MMVEPTLEFLGHNVRMIQLDQRRIRDELSTVRAKLDMDAFASLEALVRERIK